MRYAIFADIHANLAAFQAILKDVEERGGFDKVWCLGDVVGYGPDPHECVALLRSFDHLSVAGNHDWAAVGKIDTAEFNRDAAQASHWTSDQLTDSDKDYLKTLPLTVEDNVFTLVHGSPRDPIWEYLVSVSVVKANATLFTTPFCIIGHSHIPVVFEYMGDSVAYHLFSHEEKLSLSTNRLIINPGSVGQPRDGDLRASYALYDTEEKVVHHYRVAYDIEATQKKMDLYGLPAFLISRLSYGR